MTPCWKSRAAPAPSRARAVVTPSSLRRWPISALTSAPTARTSPLSRTSGKPDATSGQVQHPGDLPTEPDEPARQTRPHTRSKPRRLDTLTCGRSTEGDEEWSTIGEPQKLGDKTDLCIRLHIAQLLIVGLAYHSGCWWG
jgi:hypothetical protein